MRLIEINTILDKIIDSNGQINLEYEDIYSGGVKNVKNYYNLHKFIIIVSDFGPDISNFPVVKQILENEPESNFFPIDVNDFNSLNNYISQVAGKATQLYDFTESLLKLQGELQSDQPQQLISIKLPEGKLNDLKSLNDFNNRLEKLFKILKIDGNIEFVGFDVGSRWYKVLIGGHITYIVFLGALDISQKIIDLRQSYYESGSAKIEYLAAKKTLGKDTDEKKLEQEISEYIENKIDFEIREELKIKFKDLQDFNGKTQDEFYSQAQKIIHLLVKEMSQEGTEFHLSLHPPEYAKDIGGKLEIDYKKGVASIQKKQVKELKDGGETQKE